MAGRAGPAGPPGRGAPAPHRAARRRRRRAGPGPHGGAPGRRLRPRAARLPGPFDRAVGSRCGAPRRPGAGERDRCGGRPRDRRDADRAGRRGPPARAVRHAGAGGRRTAGLDDGAGAGRGRCRVSAPAEASSRARILAATAQVVGQQGITAFAIKDVAEAAEVTPQLLYYYFPNREALVAAALEYANEQAPSINLLQGDAGGRGFDAVHQALRAEFDDDPSVRNLNILWNEVASLSTQFPELQSTLERVTSGWDQQITVGVLRGIVDRSLRGDLEPGLVAQALTCAVEGLSQRWLAGVTSGEQARSALDRMLVALAGQGPEGG
ncbi:hypothetical protein CCO04_04485 [Pimelobacter sp. 30-1]|nr:hypothetical protein [Pimelobacter sp. 30-1]